MFDLALILDPAYAAFGQAARYRTTAGAELDVTVIRMAADRDGLGFAGARVEGERLAVRAAELADARENDVVEIADAAGELTRLRVRSAFRDGLRGEWILVVQQVVL